MKKHKVAQASALPVSVGFAFALALAVTTGCSDDNPAPMPDVAPFIGTWQVASGNLALNCGGAPLPVTQMLQGLVEITPSTMAPLQATFSDPTFMQCQILFDVINQTAVVRQGNVCALFHPLFSGTITLQSGTISVASASDATLTMSGGVDGQLTSGQLDLTGLGCMGTFTAQLLRTTADASPPKYDATTATGSDDAGS